MSASIPAEHRLITAKEAQQILGFSDASCFWRAVKKAGIPRTVLTPRRIVFDSDDLRVWLKSRTIGGMA